MATLSSVVADPWAVVAPTYRWQEPLQHASVLALLEVLSPRPGEVVVDVGSGPGLLARRLQRFPGTRRVAVEPSPAMLHAGDHAGAARLRAGAERLPLRSACVDVLTAGWVLHVLGPDVRAAAVAEVARVLRPGGRLGLVVPAVPRTVGQRLLRDAARSASALARLPAFDVPEDLPALLGDAGLQVRHHRRTERGYLADVVVATRAPAPAGPR